MSISEWVMKHPAEIGAAFAVCTAIVNVALRFKTAEEWVAFGERRPYSAALIRVIRSIGVDPVKAILAIQEALAARAARKVSK